MKYEKLYRYTAEGEGIFTIGKRLLPESLVDEAWEARKWLTKPALPPGEYRFYLTPAGKEKYEQTLLHVHQKYLHTIRLHEVSPEKIGKIVYEDEWQVVTEVGNQ